METPILVEVVPTEAIPPDRLARIHALLVRCWDPPEAFGAEDWAHALGGLHAIVRDGEEVLAHGSLVERSIRLHGRPLRVGYVEAVATAPERRRAGLGTAVMQALGERIAAGFELGLLSTGEDAFYARLGWEPWLGPTWVRRAAGPERTPDDDGGLLFLRTPSTPPIDPTAPIECDERAGDDW